MLSEGLSILALVVSVLALGSRWWVPRKERRLALLAQSHRKVEKISLAVELRIDDEIGVLPDPNPYWYDDVHQEFLKVRKIYARVKPLLGKDRLVKLDGWLQEIEEIGKERSVSGAGERIGVAEASFVRLLETALDEKAHRL